MPFAKKFRAMMELPFAGDTLGDLVVESVEVEDVAGDFGQHGYSLRMVLRGPGGQQGVRRTVGALLSARPITFSSYGNPYQLWCGRAEVESLGDKRYAVTARGAGVPIALAEALLRFLHELEDQELLVGGADGKDPEGVVARYLDRYREDIQRSVSRYRSKVAQREFERE
jgi:hypothetical protein